MDDQQITEAGWAKGHDDRLYRLAALNGEEDAVQALATLCYRQISGWAYNFCQRKPTAATVPLNQTVEGFYCLGCRQRVAAYPTARGAHFRGIIARNLDSDQS